MTMSLEQDTAQSTTIRVVFDGAPFAGKTTAARSLSEALGGSVVSPEEQDGRTLWFDWMTYSAGHHEGRAIRVELVTVPGQVHLAERRRHLIEWGDVIVFIANTSQAVFADSVARYHELRRELAGHADKPVIVIANKRDLIDAIALDEVYTQLGLTDGDTLIEGVATAGGGIRTAFIHAVRAGLDRSLDRIDATTADELLNEMQNALAAAEAQAAADAAALEGDADPTDTALADEGTVTRVEFGSPAALTDEQRMLSAPPAPLAAPALPTRSNAPSKADAPPTPNEEAAMVQSPVQLGRDAIADGEAVVVFAQHWRTIVDIALGADPARCDQTALAELTDWGLVVNGQAPDMRLPSDDTEVPSPGPAVAFPSPPEAPASPTESSDTSDVAEPATSADLDDATEPVAERRTVMF